jgi:ABC-type Zn uptake system ZnuABC Zn-binding protein ZnuA
MSPSETSSRKSPSLVLAGMLLVLACVAGVCVWAYLRHGTGRGSSTHSPPTVVVTTGILASAIRELLPGESDARIVILTPPGACPGQFDLAPETASDIRAARAILCHDYEKDLRDKMVGLGAAESSLIITETPGSLLVPDHYLRLVRGTSDMLAGPFPEHKDRMAGAVSAVENRMKVLESWVRREAAERPWAGASVIASRHQEEFCRWLGLNVTHAISRPEDLMPKEWEGVQSVPADLVVANLQEGTQAAEAIGRRRNLPVAVFSNFPGAPGYGASFEDLLHANMRRLDEAWARR